MDLVATAKNRVEEWIDGLQVGGRLLSQVTRQELLEQLESAAPVHRADGTLELVIPALTSLGMGIFQQSFRCNAVRVRVVPYGSC
jgi:hypothetical protein